MKVNARKLYLKMLITPRLNLKCDDVKIRLAYVSNKVGNGWLIENLENDSKTEWYKDLDTKGVVELITSKYKDVSITWSRSC